MPHRRSRGLLVAPLIIMLCVPLLGNAPSSAVPLVLARFAGFAGRVEYSGHRTDVLGPEVRGTAAISRDGFVLEERGARYVLHADESGLVVRAGTTTARAADPLDADALVNAWAVAMAALARGGLTPAGRNAWQTPSGLVIYTDPAGTSVAGMTAGPAARVAFTFTAWGDVGGLAVPTRILRLRHGLSDASFQIDQLDIIRNSVGAAAEARSLAGSAASQPGQIVVQPDAMRAPAAPPFPWRQVLTLFGLALLAIAIVAWLRRDAFAARLCRWQAKDPRAWRGLQSAAYVDADGVLWLEGNAYKVGPDFFARSVEVQHSALFVRISAPGVTRVVVLPRRLPRFAPQRAVKRRAAAHGLSLIETLVAVALFAVVIVAVVYPTLIAIAQADLVAAQKRAALLAAANALTDEEAACAYGQAVATGTTTTEVNGMTVSVAVSDAPVPGAHDILVSAKDASGDVLAVLATTVGPPVPSPETGGPPSGGRH